MNQEKYKDNHIAPNLQLRKTNEKDSIIKVVLEKDTLLTKE